jgi:hypothetical protein
MRLPRCILIAALVSALAVPTVTMTGCSQSAYQVAANAQQALTAAIKAAVADAPLIPVADQPVYNRFTGLAETLDNQLTTCITAVGTSGKAAAFVACFNAFSSGLLSPAEQQQLGLLSSATLQKVQLIVIGVTAIVNIALAAYQAATTTAPQLAVTTGEEREEYYDHLCNQMDCSAMSRAEFVAVGQ